MTFNEPQGTSKKFLLGNGVLAVALIVLLVMGKLWEWLGVFAMVLWIALVGVGIYLLLSEKSEPPAAL